MSPRSQTDTRRRLLDAGASLFARLGVAAVHSNQLAREAGVGVGTFYAHFADKHELLAALVLEALGELRRRAEQLEELDDTHSDPEVLVRGLVESVVGLAEERPDLFRAAFAREAVAASGRPSVGYSTRLAARRLTELQQAGRVESSIHAELAARAFGFTQNGTICWWLEDRTRATRAELVDTLVRLHPAIAGRTH